MVKGDSLSHMEVENGSILHVHDYGWNGSFVGVLELCLLLEKLGIMTLEHFIATNTERWDDFK